MKRPEPAETPRHVLLIAAAVVAMVALIFVYGPAYLAPEGVPPATLASVAAADEPIAAEADVFRMTPEDLAVPPISSRRRGAHRRTLAMYRTLRAYPGAPPRIPHGLTAGEFRNGSCKPCHERGGFVSRFGAYAPVTPHAEYHGCLQCHVPEDDIVGIEPTVSGRDAQCAQCHAPDGRTPAFVPVDWRPLRVPDTGQRALPGSPPAIPHELQLRGNCLSCHMGPTAVEEIQTTHPERASCRQCHVTARVEEAEFTRPLDGARPSGGDS